jgi:glycosyltransferase involved in cell wall biosynthesis
LVSGDEQRFENLHMRHYSLPAVSVIVPWLDVPVPDVLRAVRSVIEQDFDGFIEVVICNDGSTPNLVDALLAALAAQRWGKVEYRVCHHEGRRGPAAARNTAIRAARGEWLVWVDSDDELAHGALAALVQNAERKGAGLATSQCWVLEPSKRVRRRPDVYLKLGRQYRGTVFDPLAQAVFSLHPQMMRRDRFEELGGFDESYRWAEVTDMFLRFVARNSLDEVLVLEEPLYNYWRRDASLSTNRENITAARRTVLLSYARSLSLPIEDLWYLGSCPDLGAQHFLPIVGGQAVYPPYMKMRDNRVYIADPAAAPGRASTSGRMSTDSPLWESTP